MYLTLPIYASDLDLKYPKDETKNTSYNKNMANTFKRAIGGQTLRKKLSGTVFKAGTKQRFTQKSFQKQLQQSTNPLLRRKLGFNKGGTIKKHEALQTAEAFYKEATEKKDAYSLDSYLLKKAGVTVEGGKISKIGSERMYTTMAQEELKAEAPIGPSKEELEKQKKHAQALAQMHKWERARQIDLESKQKKESKGALQDPQGPQGPTQMKNGDEGNKNMRMPTMAHGSLGQMRQARAGDRASFSAAMQVSAEDDAMNPLIHRMQEEGAVMPDASNVEDTIPANRNDEANTPAVPPGASDAGEPQINAPVIEEAHTNQSDSQDDAPASVEPSENNEKEDT